MIDLERSLAELAERMEIPGGDWLATDVLRRVAEPQPRRRPRFALRLAGALCAVAVLVLVALPGPRRAVARWLGFDSVSIEPGATAPTTVQAATTAPATTNVATTVTTTTIVVLPALQLGPPVSMAEAVSATGLADPTPALLGPPRSVHVVEPPASGQIVLVFAPSELLSRSPVTGVGALVSVLPAHLDEGMFRKMLGDSATVQPVEVDGADGFWIEGSPHQLFFEIDGKIENETLRLATNTLLWQRGELVYRVEADVPLGVALRIAASIQ